MIPRGTPSEAEISTDKTQLSVAIKLKNSLGFPPAVDKSPNLLRLSHQRHRNLVYFLWSVLTGLPNPLTQP
jgi:hypothetical protein